MSRLTLFPFLTLKRRRSSTIYNNIKKDHHNKRNLHGSRLLEKVHIPNKKCKKIRTQQAMIINKRRKKVKINMMMRLGTFLFLQSIVIITIEKNILLWTSSREEEITWANKTRLVGLFEVEWKTPYHNILVDFLNN
jgi:hypothetical protein